MRGPIIIETSGSVDPRTKVGTPARSNFLFIPPHASLVPYVQGIREIFEVLVSRNEFGIVGPGSTKYDAVS